MCIYIEQVDFVLRSLDTRCTAADHDIAVSLIAEIIEHARKDGAIVAPVELETISNFKMDYSKDNSCCNC